MFNPSVTCFGACERAFRIWEGNVDFTICEKLVDFADCDECPGTTGRQTFQPTCLTEIEVEAG